MSKNILAIVLTLTALTVVGFFSFATLAEANAPSNYYGVCTYHAYKLCVGNNIYWYSSCGLQQNLYQICSGGTVCQYGQCVVKPQTPPVVPITPAYVAEYKTSCYNNNLYWYDSVGTKTGLYKSCDDGNNCTQDICAEDNCSNIIKCDGSTCLTGSVDYNSYCLPTQPVPTLNNNNNNNSPNINSGLSISFFAKENENSTQWQKTVQATPNSQIYFMISIVNNSTFQIDNATVSANIPQAISLIGNLQINGVPITGDIVSGISIGSLIQGASKTITFEGKTQAFSTQGAKEAFAYTVGQTDSVSINFNQSQTTASVSSVAQTFNFWDFLKRWYLWILVAVVLIFIFFMVFRRLSSAT